MLRQLSEHELVTIQLQSESTSLRDASMLFEGVTAMCPKIKIRLSQGHSSVTNPVFERAVASIRNRKKRFLGSAEERSVKHLKLSLEKEPRSILDDLLFFKH